MSGRRLALVAGGGTGGHLVPALAVARALAPAGEGEAVELVGSRRGLDAQLLAGEGLPVTLLPGRGLLRRRDVRAVLANVGAVLSLVAALAAAVVVVARRRPAVVVAMGGYASVACALAGAALRVPVVLVNVDVVPGAANRLVSKVASACAVGYPGTPLPRAVVTGVPVRPAVAAAAHPGPVERAAARSTLGLPSGRTVVAVVGGSLGARRLNEAVLDLARRFAGRGDVALYHVVGRRDAEWAAAAAPPAPAPTGEPERLWYRQVPYEERMPLFYQAADVVVARAGANTVAELAVVGVPAVLVPLPGAPGDHQAANAAVLVAAGGAVLVPDPECSGERLAAELDALVGTPGRLGAMAGAAAAVGRPDALEAVVDLVRHRARPGRWSAGARAR
ncbi:MAG TPA: glycosyltransferase [Acidimicrobiales bacterium]|nr:glycosyltransferase [Acidimicrobiales bacterium]